MDSSTPRWVVIPPDEGLWVAPPGPADIAYFLGAIVPNVRPITREEYADGPMVILSTGARSSYLLHQSHLYWLVEREPGLVVVRFSPTGQFGFTALRSPVPEFGGRSPHPDDVARFDEDAENHQYNLVFHAWDAAFDADLRQDLGFTPADDDTVQQYRAALSPAELVGARLQKRLDTPELREQWLQQAQDNLARMAGDGIRIP